MSGRWSPTRRQFIRSAGTTSLAALAGCLGEDGTISNGADAPPTPRPAPSAPADVSTTLRASTGTIQPGPDASTETWLYDGEFPGPELRLAEGDVLGVPDVTQSPVGPGDSFTYKFRAEPAGTYFFHSHVGLQLDRGLLAPLVVEEPDPHVSFDREFTVVVDDFLTGEPRPLSEIGSGRGTGGGDGPGGGGMGGGGMGGGMVPDRRPPYDGLLIGGRLPEDPRTYRVEEGERVRFRFVNASSATAFRVRVAGHPLTVTHADGRPVEPVTVDSFSFGSGERYDAIVEANEPGTWELRATAVDGNEPPARAILSYGDESETPTTPASGGTRLSYGDLQAITPLSGVDGSPDRTFDLTLSAAQGGTRWLIDGQAYPDADPLSVREGEHVRVRMANRSPVIHPMHLHGHFFLVGNAVKDTVVVPSHMGQVTFDFVADNPGNWLFHCHNLYHLDAGMARVVQYVS